jgi:hypothetical protein
MTRAMRMRQRRRARRFSFMKVGSGKWVVESGFAIHHPLPTVGFS